MRIFIRLRGFSFLFSSVSTNFSYLSFHLIPHLASHPTTRLSSHASHRSALRIFLVFLTSLTSLRFSFCLLYFSIFSRVSRYALCSSHFPTSLPPFLPSSLPPCLPVSLPHRFIRIIFHPRLASHPPSRLSSPSRTAPPSVFSSFFSPLPPCSASLFVCCIFPYFPASPVTPCAHLTSRPCLHASLSPCLPASLLPCFHVSLPHRFIRIIFHPPAAYENPFLPS